MCSKGPKCHATILNSQTTKGRLCSLCDGTISASYAFCAVGPFQLLEPIEKDAAICAV